MFALPPLPYRYDALGPVISEETLRTHHGKHHAKYVENVNSLLAARPVRFETLEQVVAHASNTGDRKLFDNAGQAWNHAFFWSCMTPRESRPGEVLSAAIEAAFGDLSTLEARFVQEGAGHFGSGWVWLIARNGTLEVATTHDGDTALVHDGLPLLVCDVWEHAYYLDHKNDRAGFLSAWWERLVDWSFVERQYGASTGEGEAWRFASVDVAAVGA
ncbi:MAG: superoxide dismutase [Phenylobacterium sp.]|uniref:superoxide dismutase n=2 Tax=Phenylobacterium sp. TaxID=1871053 RepID=UPI002A35F880|nr:superoxide dismutase [Phenylobacterium sp.]MDX9997406.1 superoxide dismutase [Phenylobacterium sp.]